MSVKHQGRVDVLLALNLRQMQGADSALAAELGVLTSEVAVRAKRSIGSTAALLSKMRALGWVKSTPGDGKQLGWVLVADGVAALERWRNGKPMEQRESASSTGGVPVPGLLDVPADQALMDGMLVFDPSYLGHPHVWTVAKVHKRSATLVWSDAKIAMTATVKRTTLPKGWRVVDPGTLARAVADLLG